MDERLFTELRRTSNRWILRTIERASFISRREIKREITVDIDGDQLLQIYKRTEGRKLPFIRRKTVFSFPLPLGLYEKKNIPLIDITLNGKPVQVIPQEEIRGYGFRRLSDSLDGLTKASDPNLRDFVRENSSDLRRWLRIFLETSQKDVQESQILNLMERRTNLSKILSYFFGKIESELLGQADELYQSFLVEIGRFLKGNPQTRQFSGSVYKHVITVMIPFLAISSWIRQQEGGDKKDARKFIEDLETWKKFLEHLRVQKDSKDKENVDKFFRSLVFRTGYTHLAVHITGKEEELRGRWKIKMEYTNAYEPMKGTIKILRALSKATGKGVSWPKKLWWEVSNILWEGFLTKHVIRLESIYLGGRSYHFYFEVPSTYSSISRVYPLARKNRSDFDIVEHSFHDYARVSNQEGQEELYNSNGYMVVIQLSRLLVLFFGLGLAIMILFIYEPLLRNFSTVIEPFSLGYSPSHLWTGMKEALSYKIVAKNSFLSVFNIFPWLLILVAIPFNSFLTDQGLSYVWKSMGITLFFSVLITGIDIFSSYLSLGLYLFLFLVNITVIIYFALNQRFCLKRKDKPLLMMIKNNVYTFYKR